MDTTRFPIDYDSIAKGDVIPAARIERVMNVDRRDRDAFKMAAMQLKARVVADLWRMGKKWTLSQKGDDIVVLTDAQAAEYTDRQIELDLRAMAKMLRHQLAVDVSALDDDQRSEHERNLEVNSKTLQAATSARRSTLRLTAHQRSTPGLPEAKTA